MKDKFKNSGVFDALNVAIDKRLERKQLYGDQWKKMRDWELLALIEQKSGRLEHFIIENRNEKHTYENKKDSAIDLVVYALFLLQKTIEEEKNANSDR